MIGEVGVMTVRCQPAITRWQPVVAPVPVVKGIGGLTVTGVDVGLPPVRLGAGAGVWRQRAASEESEMVALVASKGGFSHP